MIVTLIHWLRRRAGHVVGARPEAQWLGPSVPDDPGVRARLASFYAAAATGSGAGADEETIGSAHHARLSQKLLGAAGVERVLRDRPIHRVVVTDRRRHVAVGDDALALEQSVGQGPSVDGVQDRAQYMEKQPRLMERLKAGEQRCAGVNYGF